jgi:predicted ester cyclase
MFTMQGRGGCFTAGSLHDLSLAIGRYFPLDAKENFVDPKRTVLNLMASIQKGDFEKARTLLSKNFQFSGPAREPVGGDAWLAMSKELKIAFPDLEYHFYVENMIADTASISTHLKGTQTGTLDLTCMGIGTFRATHRSFSAVRESAKVTVKGDQVTSWVVQPAEGAGLKAILGQLGIHPPTL